jgi:hypothetical protein
VSLTASVALFAAPALAREPKAVVDAASTKPTVEMTDTELITGPMGRCLGLNWRPDDG